MALMISLAIFLLYAEATPIFLHRQGHLPQGTAPRAEGKTSGLRRYPHFHSGYNLPVYYGKGIIKEHLHCRSSASIFDVSHMGQLVITGPDRLKLLQRTTVGSTVRKSKPGITECYLTMFLNEKAGIIDDAIATNLEQEQTVRIVVNGANKYIVVKHLQEVIAKEGYKVDLKLLEENGLIALQGPKSA